MQKIKSSALVASACAVLVVASVLGACSRAVKPPEPVKIEGSVTAAADINPDRTGRPSPVVLRIYQLRRVDAFQEADFFALFDEESKTLADALISRQEMNVRPGSTAAFPVAVSQEAQYLGVLAAFRDYNDAQWRATVELERLRTGVVFKKPVRVEVRVEGRKVAMSVHEPSD